MSSSRRAKALNSKSLVKIATRAPALALLAGTWPLQLALPAAAEEFQGGNIHIISPWSRATPPGAPVAGGYMLIKNTGGSADTLLGATSPIAKEGQVHEMHMDAQVMRMRELTHGLTIPAHGEVTLKPGNYHLMFTGLNTQLKLGTKFDAVLNFAHAGKIKVIFQVGSMAAMKPDSDMSESMKMDGMKDMKK
ncbi:MAG: copper chaperone PCu(A)C [Hyphomicrobiales bacterium]|nr:copper chaperone PCu(A)C [Hyphomicrobiales bacterium]MDE2113590.1 copper chaperone PCu(A)C [Hyphomicrobiales bacterium]